MVIVRALDAAFVEGDAAPLVAPLRFTLAAGATLGLTQPSARAASVAARMCAAIVKPSSGTLYIGEYETRLQPPQAKRLVGFVDAAGFGADAHAFRCEVAFRADVWGLDVQRAQSRAQAVLQVLGDDEYARAIALALVADVPLVVLDQPGSRYTVRVRDLAPTAAIVRTATAVAQIRPRTPVLAPAAT